MKINQYETGSSGYSWENLLPDEVFSAAKFHVYTAQQSRIGKEWRGSQFENHYNRIYYIAQGHGELVLKDRVMELKPGCAYFIPAYQILSHRCHHELHIYWTHFQASLDCGLDLFMVYGDAIELTADTHVVMEGFCSLIAACSNPLASASIVRTRYLLDLLLPFLAVFQSNETAYFKHRSRSMLSVLVEMNADLCKNINIGELAKRKKMSAEHFSRLFKDAFNITPKRYIIEKRIALAKQLLLVNIQSVDEIAERCGFCDIYYFSRVFKQETGYSPTQFQRAHRVLPE